MSDSLIKVHNLSYSYHIDQQVVHVLSHVSFEIKKGEMVAIQGVSGSGKSTLLYLLGGLIHTQKGKIILDGVNISHLSADQLALFRNQKMGYVFQQFHLLPRSSVIENILLPVRYRPTVTKSSECRKRAIDLANLMGLSHRLDHFPSQLSGGQQQRVAIARALMNDPEIILADEPTGNLDSKSSEQILEHLKELNQKGKTVVIITHDGQVAQNCQRVLHIKDGRLIDGPEQVSEEHHYEINKKGSKKFPTPPTHWSFHSVGEAFATLTRHKLRSFLTMLGIMIGVASIISMLTLGIYTKQKVLDSYIELGVNTLMFQGYPNWNVKATDIYPVPFEAFNNDYDLKPLFKIFPQIERLSPTISTWGTRIMANGKTVEDSRGIGVNVDGMRISNKKIVLGSGINQYHIDNRSGVCVIGQEIAKTLFNKINPIGQLVTIADNSATYNCRVIGLMEKIGSNKEWIRDKDFFTSYTFLQTNVNNWWTSRIHEFLIELKPGTDIEKIGKSLKGFFKLKYGTSGNFFPNTQMLLINHMQRFLNLFTLLLSVIALISLLVGGIGVTNMMLVSVTERFREIGLKKALGATNRLIRRQFLLESVILCLVAGVLGLLLGVSFYQLAIWGASMLIPKFQYEWVFNTFAFTLSTISILLVGFLSGLFPAMRAERLQIIDSLRSE